MQHLTTEQSLRLKRTERRMLRRISGKSLREKMPTVELREHMNVESIVDALKRGRWRWYEHVKNEKAMTNGLEK